MSRIRNKEKEREKERYFFFSDKFGNTALKLACQRRNKELIRLLCAQKGINPNKASHDGKTALHDAAVCCPVETFEHIVKSTNADLDCVDEKGRTVLMHAAANDDLDIVKFLTMHHSAGMDKQSQSGWTALYHACEGGSLQVVDYLITEVSADISITDDLGWNLLHKSSNENHSKVVEYLLTNKRFQCNVRTKQYLCTPLHLACEKDSLESAKVLIKYSADIEGRDAEEKTPLHYACWYDSHKVAKYLMEENRATVNVSDKEGNTPQQFDCSRGLFEMAKHPVQHGAKVNAKQNNGHETLHKTNTIRSMKIV